MYYKLNKKEYKEVEKEFKNTYVGAQYYIAKTVYAVFLNVLLLLYLFCWLLFDEVDLNSFTIFMFIYMLICAFSSILYNIEYRKELKEFYNEKKKNK